MPKTVKVRIACAVTSSGAWNAAGWSGAPEEEMTGTAWEGLNGQCSADASEVVHWITAEVPVPESAEIEGALEEGEAQEEQATDQARPVPEVLDLMAALKASLAKGQWSPESKGNPGAEEDLAP